ncbi:MAG: 50S ribosomal protein L9 [Gammaproteobacteria bacterium]|nr:MAG: 50S ribosomal protein L9 [Gammaproteobacteria bacterium]
MDVILLEKIQGLGDLGDCVNVKPGYGRNYLIPQGKAARATPDNIAQFEQRREELEAKARTSLGASQSRAGALEGMAVCIRSRVSGEGRLYGSVGTREIADALSEKGVPVDKAEVVLDHGAIREVGEYDIPVRLHVDVIATVKVTIEGERLEAGEDLEELLEAEAPQDVGQESGESPEPDEAASDDSEKDKPAGERSE